MNVDKLPQHLREPYDQQRPAPVDGLDFARGVIYGLGLGLIFWGIVVVIALTVL
jgi:hypothetical protein